MGSAIVTDEMGSHPHPEIGGSKKSAIRNIEIERVDFRGV
jgi:hypothetical protein